MTDWRYHQEHPPLSSSPPTSSRRSINYYGATCASKYENVTLEDKIKLTVHRGNEIVPYMGKHENSYLHNTVRRYPEGDNINLDLHKGQIKLPN